MPGEVKYQAGSSARQGSSARRNNQGKGSRMVSEQQGFGTTTPLKCWAVRGSHDLGTEKTEQMVEKGAL